MGLPLEVPTRLTEFLQRFSNSLPKTSFLLFKVPEEQLREGSHEDFRGGQ
jgi:hypothetical protein